MLCERIPVLQNKIILLNSGNWKLKEWCSAGWKRTLYLHVVCRYIRSSSLGLIFKLLSHDMCLISFNNRHSDRPEYMGGMFKNNLPCSSCVQEPMCYVQTMCECVLRCVCASFLPSCCCADQCCHLFHWPACDGAPLNLWRNSMWDLGSKNESDGRNKKQTSRGFGSTNRNTMLHQKKKKKSPTMIVLRGTAAARPPLTLSRDTCGQIGITEKRCASSECFVHYKTSTFEERNVTYRIKVGINGSSFDQSNCLAWGWHRGSKELGCSLLPIQTSRHASKLSGVKLLCSTL